MKEIEIDCPLCNGQGWIIGTEAGHGCDGTEEDCYRTCPIQVQIQIQCEMCQGTGSIIEPENETTK